MNDKLIEFAHLCLDIYDFELTNNPRQRGGEVSQLREMVHQREAMLKDLSEERFNLEKQWWLTTENTTKITEKKS